MPGSSNIFLDWLALQSPEEKTAPEAATVSISSRDGIGRRVVIAAVGLAIAGAASPIAVAAMAAAGGRLGSALAASAFAALLIVAPAAVGLAAALSGLRRTVAVFSRRGDSEAEQAVLRVFVDTLVFGWALGLAGALPNDGAAPPAIVPVAALGLAAAWAFLLHVILWPAAPPARRGAAMALDSVLLSAFLHFGGGAVAGWYPLYLAAIFYAGFRFGLGALVGNTIAALLGFAAVILSTAFWRQEAGLALGLLVALAVLPAVVAGMIRAILRARIAGSAAEADRHEALQLIADNLRFPLARLATLTAAADEAAEATRIAASRLGDVAAFASLEAGAFTAPFEPFDLRALVRHSLAALQADAVARAVVLRWRIDPRLPMRLRGPAQTVARILASLAEDAVAAASPGTVRIAVDAVCCNTRSVRLRVRADGAGADREPALASPDGLPAQRLIERMATRIGGQFAVDRSPRGRARLTLTLTLAIAEGTAEPFVDLAESPVLIVTEDGLLAGELAGMLGDWHGEVSWVGDGDDALAELSRLDPARRVVVIVDGRDRLLSALSLVHHAARLGPDAPFVLLIADPAQIDSLVELDEGELDAFLPFPVTGRLLANALHALPLGPSGPDRAANATFVDPPRRAREATGQITPIAAHPRFVPDAAAAVDARVIEGLRALGGGAGFSGFLSELIESFRAEAGQLMEAATAAVASGDAAGFARSLAALHRTAELLGGTRLCELLASLQGLTADELPRRGALHVQRLDAEIHRLTVALLDFLPANAARRPQ